MDSCRTPQLLERDLELAELEACIRDAGQGRGAVVLIEGPAGIGKTALLAEVRRRAAAASLKVRFARGCKLEQPLPFAVVDRLLQRPAELASKDGASLLPLLQDRYRRLAELSARTPLVLAIDDAHLVDEQSLTWLAFMANRVIDLAVLAVLAVKTDDPAGDDVLERLGPLDEPRRHRLAPLSARATRRLLGAPDGLCAASHEATGGNPFLLHELARELSAERQRVGDDPCLVREIGPEAVGQAVLGRLRRMGTEATALATSVAVLGDGVELRCAAAHAEVDLSQAGDLADGLARAAIFAGGRPLAFRHPIEAVALDLQLPAAACARAHLAAARLLASDGAPPRQLARHLLLTEPTGDPWVLEALCAAARSAAERGAVATAVACFARATREPAPAPLRATLLHELGAAELRLSRPDAAEHLREAVEASPSVVARTAAREALAQALVHAGRRGDACALLHDSLHRPGYEHTGLRLRAETQLATHALVDAGLRCAASHRLAEQHAPKPADSTVAHAVSAAHAFDALLSGRPAVEAVALAAPALLAVAEDDARLEGSAFLLAAAVLVYADRYGEAEDALASASRAARARGSVAGASAAAALRALLHLRWGRLREAEEDGRRALEPPGQCLGMRALALAAVIGTHIERGALEEAQSTLSLATGDGWPGLAEHGRGLLLLAERNPEAALESFQAAGRRLCAWGVRNPTVVPWRSSAAVALLAVGDRRRARRLAESEVTDARAFGAPRAAGIALRALGLAEGGVVGLAVLERATAVLAHSGARLEHARALTELGATQRTLGLRVAARESLRAGLDLAYRCQASALVERSRGELRAVGLRPRRPSLSGNGALTPAERRVADLAADGLTNREIARTLFVSAKTIESHLASAYKKLGIHSRVQLARLLAHR